MNPNEQKISPFTICQYCGNTLKDGQAKCSNCGGINSEQSSPTSKPEITSDYGELIGELRTIVDQLISDSEIEELLDLFGGTTTDAILNLGGAVLISAALYCTFNLRDYGTPESDLLNLLSYCMFIIGFIPIARSIKGVYTPVSTTDEFKQQVRSASNHDLQQLLSLKNSIGDQTDDINLLSKLVTVLKLNSDRFVRLGLTESQSKQLIKWCNDRLLIN